MRQTRSEMLVDPLKPWHARPATGFGRLDWVVIGRCPMQLDPGCGEEPVDGEDYSPCSSECGCNCAHCDGEGTHTIAINLTEKEANEVIEMGSIAEVEQYLLSFGDRFVREEFPHDARWQRRIIANPLSKDALKVFPRYVGYDQPSV